MKFWEALNIDVYEYDNMINRLGGIGKKHSSCCYDSEISQPPHLHESQK